jgi:hypothetical protein
MAVSRSFLLRIRPVSDKSSRENQNTDSNFNIFLFEKSAVYEILWKNFVEPGRPQMTIWRMRFSCWIPKGTSTDSHVYWFSIAIMVGLMCLNVTFIRRLPVLSFFSLDRRMRPSNVIN